jgi:hypothetical protein
VASDNRWHQLGPRPQGSPAGELARGGAGATPNGQVTDRLGVSLLQDLGAEEVLAQREVLEDATRDQQHQQQADSQ